MGKKLYRSRNSKVIAGVCGGIAEYFTIDPVIVRLAWVAISFLGGAGILIYILAAFIMPQETDNTFKTGFNESSFNENSESSFNENNAPFSENANDWGEPVKQNNDKNRVLLGCALVVIGIAFAARHLFSWFNFNYFWPFVLVALGALLLVKGRRAS